ncbi:uncharacterized protein LOC123672729 [Harmonia axyridis]|uniref:uncharacterized protein LOC123672729 n=1 Tax=Harmonia axyridis TaxID=115357 RepID=UPI001E275AB9|nr:uncharacterized protein LOC123672729 [Harmonia axyridis]
MPTKKRKREYIGDLSSSDFSTPEKRRRSLKNVKTVISQQRTKIRSLRTKVKRQKRRITKLKNLVSSLNEKYQLTEASQQAILASVLKTARHIFKQIMGGPSRQKYDPSLGAFVQTLAFYSPQAYNYVRRTFNGSLPHLGNFKIYHAVDGSPGFTKETLIAITSKNDFN